jgi:hypothetical protein
MIEEADHLLRIQLHRVVPRVARHVALAVTQQVQQDHPVPALGEGFGQRDVVLAGEQQPVYENDRTIGDIGGAELLIRQHEAVVFEEVVHGRSLGAG